MTKRRGGWRAFAVVLIVLPALALQPPAVHADDVGNDGITGTAGAEDILLEGFTVADGSQPADEQNVSELESGAHVGSAENHGPYTYTESRWNPLCGASGGRTVDATQACGMVRGCDDGVLATYYTRQVHVGSSGATTAGMWEYAGEQCITFDPNNPPQGGAGPAPLPQVTWQMVLREVQRVGLPSLQVQVQPAGRTLVNFETNFYAEPEAFERQLTLLGQGVEVRAEPVEFAWTFGDGTTDATDSPGAPYPELEITHAYTDADVTVEPSVDVTYAAEFRVGDGEWQDIPETVTIGGDAVSLRVVEATPVLSGEAQQP
jgi:hypothetical protein